MALFSNIEEIAKILPINLGGTDFSTTIPILTQAEDNYLKKILSDTVFDQLKVEYDYFIENNEWDNPSYEKLLDIARPVAVFMGYHDSMSIISFQISDSGTYTQASDDSIPLKQWQYKELRTMLSTKGMKAIENLYKWLESNKATEASATAWAGSSAYPEYKKYFINSTTEFQNCVNIGNSRWTYLSLLPYMEDQELLLIKPLIGDEYFAELKTKIADDTLDAYDTKAVKYISKCIANYTLSFAVSQLAVQIDNDGVTVLSASGSSDVNMREGASDARIAEFKNESRKTGASYSELLMSYLIKEASNIPTWEASDTYLALTNPDNSTSNFDNDNSSTSFFM